MEGFEYTIRDEIGIHARPAGMLVKEVKKFHSVVTLTKGDKTADASRMIAVMGLGVRTGETVKITVEGEDEKEACNAIKSFFEENL